MFNEKQHSPGGRYGHVDTQREMLPLLDEAEVLEKTRKSSKKSISYMSRKLGNILSPIMLQQVQGRKVIIGHSDNITK